MKTILVAIFVFSTYMRNGQSVPVNLGEYDSPEACEAAAAKVRASADVKTLCLPTKTKAK